MSNHIPTGLGDEIRGVWPGACFGCSSVNPHGLHLRFRHTPTGSFTRFSVPAGFCGFDGLVHGGIIATLLDEAAAWALFGRLGRFGLTSEMVTRYLKPVPVISELVVTGDVIRHDQRSAAILAQIRNNDGVLLAEAESAWVFPKLSRIAAITGKDEALLRRFLEECCPVRGDALHLRE